MDDALQEFDDEFVRDVARQVEAAEIAKQLEVEQFVQSIAIIAVGLAALSIWLGVRIYNRRERWAKWTLTLVVALPVLYAASFGPAIRAYHHNPTHEAYAMVVKWYRPFLIIVGRSPAGARWTVEQVVRLWLPSDLNFGIHTDDSANFGIWPVAFD
jgi:hypothetical protein